MDNFIADKKKKKQKSVGSIDEEAGEAVPGPSGLAGSAAQNIHPSNLMSMNTLPQHGLEMPSSSVRSAESAGSGGLTESGMTDSEHRKSRQEDDATNPRKEKSVLQAKLTKLAIQIGYAGKCFFY